MDKISGLRITAKDSKGCPYEGGGKSFKVGFIGDLAFGVANDNTTDKEFLELCVPDLEAKIKQLEAIIESAQDNVELIDDEPARKLMALALGCRDRRTEEQSSAESEGGTHLSKTELCREIRGLAMDLAQHKRQLAARDKEIAGLKAFVAAVESVYPGRFKSEQPPAGPRPDAVRRKDVR